MQRNKVVLPMLVAMTAYLPFEVVAKMTLVAAAGCWVLNPFPGARLVAMAGVAAVLAMAKVRKVWMDGRELVDGDGAVEVGGGGGGGDARVDSDAGDTKKDS